MIGLVLSLALAFGDPLGGFRETRGPVKTLDFSTFAPGCYSYTALGASLGGGIGGRDTECWNGSTFQMCNRVSQLCITTADDGLVGLRVEGNHSNLILNATTHPKVAEATGAVVAAAANNDCYIWARGAGTITATVAAGSVPSDPNSCMGRAIPAGTPIRGEACRFTIGDTTTRFAITTDATVTAAQIECRGTTSAHVFGPTALVTTVGASVLRGEALRVVFPDLIGTRSGSGQSWCMKALVAPAGRLGGPIVMGGDGSTSNGSLGRVGGLVTLTGIGRFPQTGAALHWSATWPAVTPGARHLVVASSVNGTLVSGLTVDGLPVALSPPATAPSMVTYAIRGGNLGTMPTGVAFPGFDGIISKVQFFWGPCQ